MDAEPGGFSRVDAFYCVFEIQELDCFRAEMAFFHFHEPLLFSISLPLSQNQVVFGLLPAKL